MVPSNLARQESLKKYKCSPELDTWLTTKLVIEIAKGRFTAIIEPTPQFPIGAIIEALQVFGYRVQSINGALIVTWS